MGPLESFRKSRGWTQQQLADAAGLRSKGYISAIERGLERCSASLALKIETLSEGEYKARDVVAGVLPRAPVSAHTSPGP